MDQPEKMDPKTSSGEKKDDTLSDLKKKAEERQESMDSIVKLEAKEKLSRLRWSVNVRYLLIIMVSVISVLCYELGFDFNLGGLLIAATVAFIFNVASSFIYQEINYLKYWPYIGIFIDMIAITLIVHSTGGLESIFLPLYLIQLVGTNVHFSRIAAPLNLLFGGGIFVMMIIFEYHGLIPHYGTSIIRENLYLNETYVFAMSISMISLMAISTYRSGYVVRSLQTVEKKLLKVNEKLIRMNISMTEANRRLRQLDQMKTEFISVASHQMRTPLSAIKWVMRMILDEDLGRLNKEQREMLVKGYQSNERMIGLINDLLNVSRIEEGRFQYRFIRMQLEEVFDRVIQEMSGDINKKHINFKYRKPSAPLPKVAIDPQKIHLVAQNLLDNALKYTPEGGKIVVMLQNLNREVICSIEDNGVGIPANQQDRLFTKFFRADNVIRMQTEGSGLGLFIVKNIIQQHRGRSWFESVEGKGTTFYFTLPEDIGEPPLSGFEKFIKSI